MRKNTNSNKTTFTFIDSIDIHMNRFTTAHVYEDTHAESALQSNHKPTSFTVNSCNILTGGSLSGFFGLFRLLNNEDSCSLDALNCGLEAVEDIDDESAFSIFSVTDGGPVRSIWMTFKA